MTTGAALKKSSAFLTAFLIATAPALPADPYPAAAPPAEPAVETEGDSPEVNPATGATYARVRHFEGGISLRREDESQAGQEKLAVNSPLLPGDQIWTGEDGRVEAQLADGTILRLDRNARLSFQNLADLEGAFDNTTLLRLLNGSLYVRADNFDPRSRRFQVDTPAGSVFLLGSGVFRIDVTPDGVSTVASLRGVAEVLGDDISVMAHSGERVTVEPGKKPTEARAFNTLRRDPFDVWSESRDDAYVRSDSAQGQRPEVPEPVKPYVSELSAYGAWRYDSNYGWIWIPDDQSSDWRPYYYGQWGYTPIGMTWVSYDPWGWAPYHYGRWGWSIGLGWYWAPGYVFSGAYVSWSVGPAYYGWAPLGYYGYPVYCGSYYPYYYPWAYVPYGYIYYPHVYHHYYGWSDVARHRMNDNSYVLHAAPRIRPGYRPETVGAATYRKIAANPATATRVSGLKANQPGKPFRGDDAMQYRRQIAGRATPERKTPGAKPGLNPTGPTMRTVPTRPGSMAPRISSGAGMKNVSANDDLRALPVSVGRRAAAGGGSLGVSPATGRPMQPPVKMVPRSQSGSAGTATRPSVGVMPRPVSNTLGPSEDAPVPRATRGPNDSTPGQEKPLVGRGGRITYRPETQAQAPRNVSPNGSRPGPTPHPRVATGRGGSGRGSFVMPTRTSSGVSKPSAARPGMSGPGMSRPPQGSAPRAAAAPHAGAGGGGKKGGKH